MNERSVIASRMATETSCSSLWKVLPASQLVYTSPDDNGAGLTAEHPKFARIIIADVGRQRSNRSRAIRGAEWLRRANPKLSLYMASCPGQE